jgi:hypothetical protein
MKECDRGISHTSSKLHMINIRVYIVITVDTLLTKNFTTLPYTLSNYTSLHFTSSHLNFTQLHFTLA